MLALDFDSTLSLSSVKRLESLSIAYDGTFEESEWDGSWHMWRLAWVGVEVCRNKRWHTEIKNILIQIKKKKKKKKKKKNKKKIFFFFFFLFSCFFLFWVFFFFVLKKCCITVLKIIFYRFKKKKKKKKGRGTNRDI